jgi:uncharacterized protein YhbP (UPF0306 family)
MTHAPKASSGVGASDLNRIITFNQYMVLATADATGLPWVSPVFFAPIEPDALAWVSSPDSRHSHNLTIRPDVATTVFDSTVDVGRGEGAYFEGRATRVNDLEVANVLASLNARLPEAKQLGLDDVNPHGPMVAYRLAIRRRYLLVRGGNSHYGNQLDITVEL